MKNELYDLEKVYDDEISPLVNKIIDICNEHKIPMICSFAYENSDELGYGLCTTMHNAHKNRYVKEFSEALKKIIRAPSATVLTRIF